MKNINILIIGSSGLVGNGIVRYYCEKKIKVVGISFTGKSKFKNLYFTEYKNINIVNKESLKRIEKIIVLHKINSIINCAALIPNKFKQNKINKSLERKMIKVNSYSNLSLNQICKKYDVKFYIYLSSLRISMLYKSFKKKDIKNNIDNLYIHSKIAAEKLLNNLRTKRKKPKIIILRITSPYGYLMNTNAIVPTIIKRIRAGKKIFVNGDGSRRQYLTFVGDIAKFSLKQIQQNYKSGTYNFFNPEAPSVREVINSIKKVFFKKNFFLINYNKNGNNSNDLIQKFKNKNIYNFKFTSFNSGLKIINSTKYKYE